MSDHHTRLTPASPCLAAVHRALVLLLLVVNLALLSPALDAAEPRSVELANNTTRLVFDNQTGNWTEWYIGGKRISLVPSSGISFDLKQGDQWLSGRAGIQPRLVGTNAAAGELDLLVAMGDWDVALYYVLDRHEPRLARSARLTWKGKQPTKLKGFWLGTPALKMPAGGDYFTPGAYPPKRFPAEELAAGNRRSFHGSGSPLIAQLSGERSVLWITDEKTTASDRSSIEVTEDAEGVSVRQSFASFALVHPGECQEIGTAWLRLVPGDGEAALAQIHEWMRQRGQVPPSDRPDWFQDAVLYSFHPGGTIGSSFRDVGGFEAAMPLLPRIARLGADSIWIMPIEDIAVYHPRDYYKFQEGLGTPEQYKRLVARAHQLGLKVLQDCVPHGGSNYYPRAKEHPEWLAYEEDGSTLSYWCYDFNWPTWRQYMANVARHYVSQFGVDGYRVDAVGGSRIPNWSPMIPYGRASFAQLQGGLNMLRDLRAAVKGLKPKEGGLLAEVQGSIYGTASDAVYDFTFCYQALHDIRKLPAEQFVERLRRWLHEQQAAEVPGLVRLRHVESHDSLRGQLWYGVEPFRALVALSAWIQGMPLVYHEMEHGHEAVFQRIFAIRRLLPELRRGTADYLAVQAAPEVFACLRTFENQASVVLVNCSNRPMETRVAVPVRLLPESIRGVREGRDLMADGAIATTIDAKGHVQWQQQLRPFGYTVVALGARQGLALPMAAEPSPIRTAAEGKATPPAEGNSSDKVVELSSKSPSGLRAWIDRQTGLLERLDVGGQRVLGQADLHVPAGWRDRAGVARLQQDGADWVATRQFGSAQLEIRYHWEGDALRLTTRWTGQELPSTAALYLPVRKATGWSGMGAEGLLAGPYEVRHLTADRVAGNIYWRPQGTNVVWDSLFQPLGLTSGARQIGVTAGPVCLSLAFPAEQAPARVQWLDRIGEVHELGARIAWRDPEMPQTTERAAFTVDLRAAAPQEQNSAKPVAAAASPLRAAAGGWEFENAHYRLRLSRSGMIVGLWLKNPERHLVDNSDLYTDKGFGKEMRYGAANDVEAGSRIWREGGLVRIRFEGRLRGFGRFDLPSPIEYFSEYALGETHRGFRMSWGVRPLQGPGGSTAFLGMMLPLVDPEQVVYRHEGQVLASVPIKLKAGRSWQSRNNGKGRLPDEIQLGCARGQSWGLKSLQCGPTPLENVFVDGRNLFFTWYDGPVRPEGKSPWRWATAMVDLPGAGQPLCAGAMPKIMEEPTSGGLLADGGFEEQQQRAVFALRSGKSIPGNVVPGPWTAPDAGRIVASPVHSGVSAAEVVNRTGGYDLWQHPLPLAKMPAGSRWRLTAWVKGQDIRPGNVGWKVGVVRFSLTADKTQYVSSAPLTGTFDWKKISVELTVPQGLLGVRAQVGLNGATGSMWIDDVQLERL